MLPRTAKAGGTFSSSYFRFDLKVVILSWS
jgi:hypothetical protein